MIAVTGGVMLTGQMKQKIDRKAHELQIRLPHIRPLDISILIKKSVLEYHPQKKYHSSFGSFLDKKKTLASYIGSVSIRLPKQTLRTHVIGRTVRECVKKGLDIVEKQLQKYKDHYFKSQSAYRDHQTIRRGL